MKKNKISRRHLIQSGSLAAVSAVFSPLPAMANTLHGTLPGKKISESGGADEICFMNAIDMVALLRSKKISAREVMRAHLQQIKKINAKVNAFVTLVTEDELMAEALTADEAIAKGKSTGLLHGLPIGVKDLFETKALRTTWGSPMWKDFVPASDALIVEREKKAGAIVVGKTNVPELGLGSQSFNPIFGPTLNPYDLTKTCGGSTGGGAVALACGMIPLADGSDMGGSLRNPGNFCNVVGLRPSPGRVPAVASKLAWQGLSVQGPMARTVADCAYLLAVQSGADARSPISVMEDPRQFLEPLHRNFKNVKVAFIKDFGIPWESEVIDAIKKQQKVFEALGCEVEETEPDMTDANECFLNLRHWQTELQYGDLLADNAEKMNDYTKWHIAEGRKLTGTYLSRLEMKRSLLYRRMQKFLETFQFLVLPVSQVLPFDVQVPFPTEIAGEKMINYIDWMRSCYYISVVGNPALSVPCAFSKIGLPIGIQIVGRHNADFSVLQMGFAFEQATKVAKQRPNIVN